MDENKNIASDSASNELLDYLFGEIEPFADDFIGSRPEVRRLISRWKFSDDTRVLMLLGNITWEIFSSNNEVVGRDGEVFDLGSWRGSGGFIADFLNARYEDGTFDYIDFYMGLMARGEVYQPLYGRFFELLKARGCTWRFAPPAIFLVSFGKKQDRTPPAEYDPGKAVLDEMEDRKIDQMRSEFEQMNREAFRKTVENPPPIVRAYVEVYGRRPEYVRFAG